MLVAIVIAILFVAVLGWAARYDRRHPGTTISRGRIKTLRNVAKSRRASAGRIGRMPR